MVKKFRRQFYSFWRDPRTWQTGRRTDRQTDRQTDTAWQQRPRLCIASRGDKTRRALGRAHLPPTTVFWRLKTTRRCCDGRPKPVRNTCTWDFPYVIKFRVAVHMISEKAIRFRHPDYDPDRAQKLTSSSMSRHLSTRKMSSKSMHAFWVILLTDRQTDIQTSREIAFTSSVLGGKNCARGIVLFKQWSLLLTDTKHRVASLRQQSFLSNYYYCTLGWLSSNSLLSASALSIRLQS